MPSAFVLDSFAVLALMGEEPGAKRVREVLHLSQAGSADVLLPMISVGEVLYIVERERGFGPARRMLGLMDQWPVSVLDATRERILAAAHVKANAPVSYADAFVVAAGQEFDATVLTGDPEFRSVDTLVNIAWLPV